MEVLILLSSFVLVPYNNTFAQISAMKKLFKVQTVVYDHKNRKFKKKALDVRTHSSLTLLFYKIFGCLWKKKDCQERLLYEAFKL